MHNFFSLSFLNMCVCVCVYSLGFCQTSSFHLALISLTALLDKEVQSDTSTKRWVKLCGRRGRSLTELVRLRFQQSGFSLFCSSASALAWRVNVRRSSVRIFFQRSPRRTLMALRHRRVPHKAAIHQTGMTTTRHQTRSENTPTCYPCLGTSVCTPL